ncbi:hypothetical protein [Klebsiella quasivariicola]|uniref:hypothetical protein n=1 Tax=Klebsiella quasivariicola TaxID=2026240 RepID=UPI0015C41F97|nr:hypothetical protein [Klebsiella quasivariicola]
MHEFSPYRISSLPFCGKAGRRSPVFIQHQPHDTFADQPFFAGLSLQSIGVAVRLEYSLVDNPVADEQANPLLTKLITYSGKFREGTVSLIWFLPI